MNRLTVVFLCVIFFISCRQKEKTKDTGGKLIASGQMPAITKDKQGSIHIVYGSGDSLMYTFSEDKASSFSTPQLIDLLPGLVAGATRGPQVTAVENGLIVIALNKNGNIFSYTKEEARKWIKTARVNDADTTNKEGFLGLSSDGKNNLFAIWPDLRKDKHNKIYGAGSADGGKSWHKNILVYASPDSTVCECCKPSVVMQGNTVVVMFRNLLKGNRDLYVIQSSNAGETFGTAQKLGNGSWALNGCPMDGGGLVINEKGKIQTVWRRQSKIYSCGPGEQEKLVGEGRSCNMETIKNRNIYTWSEDGNIVCLLPGGAQKTPGKGSLPILKSIDDNHVICVWENDKQIFGSVIPL